MSRGWNMMVYRDGKRTLAGRELLGGLAAELEALESARAASAQRRTLAALLRAGELECALSDVSPEASRIAHITDSLANALITGAPPEAVRLRSMLAGVDVPVRVSVSAPEGFAYYALHPLDFADLARSLALSHGSAYVIGIRTIGTTLSAVVAAALRASGIAAERTTVRPVGHPFGRQLSFTSRQLGCVQQMRASNAAFLVVDEGPGISGSSFLAAADALLAAGVERRNLWLLGSRHTDGSDLTARDARARWNSFDYRSVAAPSHMPPGVGEPLAAGEWRALAFAGEHEWPGCWRAVERMKWFSTDGRHLFKFQGIGHYGQQVFERAALLAGAGYAPGVLRTGTGFFAYEWLLRDGARAGLPADLSADLLHRIADYCAFRAGHLRNGMQAAGELAQAVRHNYAQEFGLELAGFDLRVEVPVVPDARMAPHEWIRTAAGNWIKTDGDADGDNHFFPGPADIAWDVSGAITEWQMDAHARERFLSRYVAQSGDRIQQRLPQWLLAYDVMRMAAAKMASISEWGDEQQRLHAEYLRYRARIPASASAPVAA